MAPKPIPLFSDFPIYEAPEPTQVLAPSHSSTDGKGVYPPRACVL